jgi:hypothetical protein
VGAQNGSILAPPLSTTAVMGPVTGGGRDRTTPAGGSYSRYVPRAHARSFARREWARRIRPSAVCFKSQTFPAPLIRSPPPTPPHPEPSRSLGKLKVGSEHDPIHAVIAALEKLLVQDAVCAAGPEPSSSALRLDSTTSIKV